MITRISTGMLHQQSITALLSKQAKLAHTQQQLATDTKLLSAKDDPVGAGVAVGLDRSLAELERFGANANALQNRLGLQENALTQVGGAMARIHELTVQAGNPALGNDSRRAISTELRSIKAGLLDLANSTDGAGRYLFGGAADGSAPFSVSGGSVVYAGDQTQRQVEVAPDTFVLDALPGSEIFLRLRTGDGRLDARAATANAGTGLLMDFGTVDPAQYDGGDYRIAFTAADSYEVRDASNAVIGAGTYTPGETITFAGVRVKLEGAPLAGDSFELGRSGTRDVFATVQRLIDTLDSDPVTPTQHAEMQNSLQGALRDLAGAQNRMIDSRAAGGAQLLALDNATSLRDANSITLKETLSGLRDLNWPEAIGRFNQEKLALEAAQSVFMQMQSLSLFKLMR